MKPARHLLSAILLSAAITSAPCQAGDALEPAWAPTPSTGGWYQPNSAFGNLNLDIADDGVAAGTWSTFEAGRPVWYYFQGTLQPASALQVRDDGIIATLETPLHAVLTGGACLTCAYLAPTWTPHGTMRVTFTSSRTARFSLNGGAPIPLVAWLQGAPLRAPRDYAGDWLAIARQEAANGGHFETVTHLRLDTLAGPETYEVVPPTMAYVDPPPPPPPEGARRYRVHCIGPRAACMTLDDVFLRTNIVPAWSFTMLWLDASERGFTIDASESATGYALYPPAGLPHHVHAAHDRILIRAYRVPDEGVAGVREIQLVRFPAEGFDGRAWQALTED